MPTLPTMSLTLSQPGRPDGLSMSWSKGTARTAHDFCPIVAYSNIGSIAKALYKEISKHLGNKSISLTALTSGEPSALLRSLSDNILLRRTLSRKLTLRDIFLSILQDSDERPVYVELDRRLAAIPWELLDLGDGRFLGNEVVFFCDFRKGVDEYCIFDDSQRKRGNEVRLKACGESSIPFHEIEYAALTEMKNSGVRVDFAPRLTDELERKLLFEWLVEGEYEGLHFFCHCRYPANEFELEVSDRQRFTHRDFLVGELDLHPSAFAFLNVCEAGPTMHTTENSFAEYLAREQGIGSILATLSPARSEDAAHFARQFYFSWLEGNAENYPKSMGLALWETRKSLLAEENLTAHLYRIFGQTQTILIRSTSQSEAA